MEATSRHPIWRSRVVGEVFRDTSGRCHTEKWLYDPAKLFWVGAAAGIWFGALGVVMMAFIR